MGTSKTRARLTAWESYGLDHLMVADAARKAIAYELTRGREWKLLAIRGDTPHQEEEERNWTDAFPDNVCAIVETTAVRVLEGVRLTVTVARCERWPADSELVNKPAIATP